MKALLAILAVFITALFMLGCDGCFTACEDDSDNAIVSCAASELKTVACNTADGKSGEQQMICSNNGWVEYTGCSAK